MIQFGVIKGFLRRAHAYPVWLEHPALKPRAERGSTSSSDAATATGTGGAAAAAAAAAASAKAPARAALGSKGSSAPTRRAGELPPKRVLHATLDAPAPPQHSTNSVRRASPPSRGSGAGSGDDDEDRASGAAGEGSISYPPSLALLLDGAHHTDEVCLRYGIGWRTLEAVLKDLGGGARGMERGGDDEDEDEDEEVERRERRRTRSREEEEASPYGDKVVMLWI